MNKECFLCEVGVPAVTVSPYNYAVCAMHYSEDVYEFATDYSQAFAVRGQCQNKIKRKVN